LDDIIFHHPPFRTVPLKSLMLIYLSILFWVKKVVGINVVQFFLNFCLSLLHKSQQDILKTMKCIKFIKYKCMKYSIRSAIGGSNTIVVPASVLIPYNTKRV